MSARLGPAYYVKASLAHDFLEKNDRRWRELPKSTKSAENDRFHVLRSRQQLTMPKSDKTAENSLFYVLRSRQHLKIPKTDKMAKTDLFHNKKPPVHEKKLQMTKKPKNTRKMKKNTRIRKKNEISLNNRATPPTLERAKRADQHVSASARNIKKINMMTLETPKILEKWKKKY